MEGYLAILLGTAYIFFGLFRAIKSDESDPESITNGQRILLGWLRTFLWPIGVLTSIKFKAP